MPSCVLGRVWCACVSLGRCTWLNTLSCVYGLGQTSGQTPLYIASEKGYVGVVEVLVRAGAALDQATVCDCMPCCAAGRVWCARVSLGRRTQVVML
jgi:hypothetical protein